MKNVALHNLGCKVNSYELDVVQQKFIEKGFQIVPFDQIADIYVINTCTVTNIADRKSRQMLHRAKKTNKDAIVVAMGCYVQTGQEQIELDDCIDIAIGNNHKKDAVEIIENYLIEREGTKSHIMDLSQETTYENMQLEKTSDHTRAYIKIQDGCNQFCSYCIIPFARGRVRSRDFDSIKKEIEQLISNGYQEFVLTGIHISSYGVDFDKEQYTASNSHLPELITKIHEIEGVKRIRLGSLEPRIVTTEFVELMKQLSKVCPHFHLSLQSGCDETLQRMNRKYTTDEFRQSVQLLREHYENPAITTDVIVGFPGETEEEFAKTLDFLKEINFFEMHIFPFSVRKGTVAEKLKDQIPPAIKKERAAALAQMEHEQSKEFRQKFIKKEELILFEEKKEINGVNYQIGHTSRYVKVAKETKENLSNQFVRAEIQGVLTDEILYIR